MKEYRKVIQIKISIWLSFTFWCWNKKDVFFDVNFVKHLDSKTFQLVLFETFKKDKKKERKAYNKETELKNKRFFLTIDEYSFN